MGSGQTATAEALGVGRPQRIGRYSYSVRDDAWWWSDTFFRILGFEPGEVRPSASVLASHLRPDGMDRGTDAVDAAFETGEPFSFHTQIVDGHGRHRTVLLAGHGEAGDGGRVDRVQGYLVDLTDARRDASRDDVQEARAGVLDHRAVIEQA